MFQLVSCENRDEFFDLLGLIFVTYIKEYYHLAQKVVMRMSIGKHLKACSMCDIHVLVLRSPNVDHYFL